MRAAFHARMGSGGIRQRKFLIHHRRHPPAASSGQTFARNCSAIRALARSDCGRRVDPVIVRRRVISCTKFSSTFGPCRNAICTSRPSSAKAFRLRGIYGPPTISRIRSAPPSRLYHLDKILVAVVDRGLRAQGHASRAFLVRSRRGEHPRAEAWPAGSPSCRSRLIRHGPETALPPASRRA